MKLIDLIYPAHQIVSIVGTSKNAGKTVTMNEIITQADRAGIKLGLISTGRDGERRDVLTNTEKPPVYVKTGTIVTVLERSIQSEFANLEILQVTDYTTALGRIVLARVISDGYVEISGPMSVAGIKSVTDFILSYGVDLILVDGSLDRRASAAPYLADATILATGAALARDMDLVIQKTKHIVDTYSIARLDHKEIRVLVGSIMEQGKTAIIHKNKEVTYLDLQTALNCGEEIAHYIDEETAYLVLSGSATTNTMQAILHNKNRGYKVVVKDPTKVFLPKREMKVFTNMGLELIAYETIKMIAITLNPYSPEGYYFDMDLFLKTTRETIANIPVLDVMQEG